MSLDRLYRARPDGKLVRVEEEHTRRSLLVAHCSEGDIVNCALLKILKRRVVTGTMCASGLRGRGDDVHDLTSRGCANTIRLSLHYSCEVNPLDVNDSTGAAEVDLNIRDCERDAM